MQDASEPRQHQHNMPHLPSLPTVPIPTRYLPYPTLQYHPESTKARGRVVVSRFNSHVHFEGGVTITRAIKMYSRVSSG